MSKRRKSRPPTGCNILWLQLFVIFDIMFLCSRVLTYCWHYVDVYMDYRHHVDIMSLCLSVIDMMFDIVWFIRALLSLRLRVRTSLAHPYYLRLHVHPCSTLDIMSTSCPHNVTEGLRTSRKIQIGKAFASRFSCLPSPCSWLKHPGTGRCKQRMRQMTTSQNVWTNRGRVSLGSCAHWQYRPRSNVTNHIYI